MRLRPVDEERDFGAALALLQACDRDVYGGTDWTEDELRDQWRDTDLAHDAWAADDADALVGLMQLVERRGSTFIGDGYVAPDARGRGIGTALVRALLGRVQEHLEREPTSERAVVHLSHLVGDVTAPALLAQQGFAHVRSFFRMVRLLGDVPPEPIWPAGVELRPCDPGRDGPALYAADREAFAGQWGSEDRPYAQWSNRVFATPRLDLALPVVAWAGGAIAGFALNYPKRMGDWGWVSVLAVVPAWRRQGLGLALLQESFRRFAASGETTVALGVDSENPTGATRLYERAGMHVLWQADVWEHEMRPDG